jgi:hypothetical protein
MRYQPAVLAEEVYLHPRSALAATAPEYVVYSTLLATDKRRYLVGVTPLEPHWLGTSGTPLCTGEEGGGGAGNKGRVGSLYYSSTHRRLHHVGAACSMHVV